MVSADLSNHSGQGHDTLVGLLDYDGETLSQLLGGLGVVDVRVTSIGHGMLEFLILSDGDFSLRHIESSGTSSGLVVKES
jgi:hypothetical protein